jgi:hypothetical protein
LSFLGLFGYVRRLLARLSWALAARGDASDLASRIVGEPLQSTSSGQ